MTFKRVQAQVLSAARPRHSSSADQKLELNRLCAEVKARSTTGSEASKDFFLGALRTLSTVKGTAHAETRFGCLLDCVRYFFIQGRSAEALAAARCIEKLATQTGSVEWSRKAETSLGLIHAEDGHVGQAVVHYSRALEHAYRYNELGGIVTVLINLGVALNYGSLYREAIPCLKKAIDLSSGKLDPDEMEAAAFCNLAQSYLYLEEYPAGFQAIQQCLALSAEPDDATKSFQRTVRELTFVQLALEMNELNAAREHCENCRRYARRADTIKARFLAVLADGLCEIRAGGVDRGLQILKDALASSVSGLSVFRADALGALVKSCDEAGRPEEALHYLRELMSYAIQTRAASLTALRSLPNSFDDRSAFPELTDLRALDHREAKLRAQVAERRAANSQKEMFERLAVAADLREESSGLHGYRVGALTAMLAKEVGWSAEACRAIEMAARLHDIGKTGIPDRILLSSELLADADRQYIIAHTTVGAELLGNGESVQMQMAQEIARYHHEWWNGDGYPTKVRGKRIPLHARMVALADVFDALTHGRPYAPPWTAERALAEIASRRSLQFDPALTDAFLVVVERERRARADFDGFLGRGGENSPFLLARARIKQMLGPA